jgi:hypothetical protein
MKYLIAIVCATIAGYLCFASLKQGSKSLADQYTPIPRTLPPKLPSTTTVTQTTPTKTSIFKTGNAPTPKNTNCKGGVCGGPPPPGYKKYKGPSQEDIQRAIANANPHGVPVIIKGPINIKMEKEH